MKEGEKKALKPIETNRGLTDHGPLTLNTVSVFTRGKSITLRHGRSPYLHLPGTGGANRLDADSFLGHAIMAIEDNSEFHCIMPRDVTPKFWRREVLNYEKGNVFCILKDSWVYVARGELENNPLGARMIHITETQFITVAADDTTVAILWREPGDK